MSTHEVKVVRVFKKEPAQNADALEKVFIEDGEQQYLYDIIAAKDQFQVGDLGAYVEPDYVVKSSIPEFAFLGNKPTYRIKGRRLRGNWSEGLLVKARPEWVFNADVMEELEVVRYEPPPPRSFRGWSQGSNLKGGTAGESPPFAMPPAYYDLENFKKYYAIFPEELDVIFTVKYHGSQARFVFLEDTFYIGSRTVWKKKDGDSSWHIAVQQNPWIEEWCRANPGMIVYGEIIGNDVQGDKYHYGHPKGSIGLVIFDVLNSATGEFVDNALLHSDPRFNTLNKVEVLYRGKVDREALYALAELDETYNNCGHTREGIVIKPAIEDYSVFRSKRTALKYVSRRYLTGE